MPRFEGSSPDSQQGVGAALAALWRVALLSSAELCDFVDASAEEETVTRDLNWSFKKLGELIQIFILIYPRQYVQQRLGYRSEDVTKSLPQIE